MLLGIDRVFPKEIARAYRYLHNSKINRGSLLMSVGLSVVVAFLNLYVMMLLFPLVQGIIAHDFTGVKSLAVLGRFVGRFPQIFSHQSSLFALLVVWVYFNSVAKSGLAYLLALLIRKEALYAALQMRITILDRFLNFGKLFFDRQDISTLVWQSANCNKWIESLFVSVQSLLSRYLEIVVYLSLMTAISWKLTLAVLLAVPLFRITNLLLKRIQEISAHYDKSLAILNTSLTQLLSSLTLVRTSGQTNQERQRFIDLGTEEITVAMQVHKIMSLMEPVQAISGTTALLFMALCLSLFVPAGRVGSAEIFIFTFLVMRVIPVLNATGKFRAAVARETVAAKSFDSLMNDEDKYMVLSGPRMFSGVFQKIEMRNLNFSYQQKKPVLQELSVTIPQGITIGLVGPVGAGKTTLVHLLFRFYECPPGTIFIDGTDIREFNIESLREHMALVSQDAPVLNDTVRANILYSAAKTPSESEFNRILEKARLTEFIVNLPQQLDTMVGERGIRLSGGERQRIAIARALLKDASLLVLDEPTSALDPENERLIAEATHEIMREKTTIVIAHRMSTIRNANMILFLDKGKLVQHGPYAQLAANPGPFRQFLQAQRLPAADV